MTILAGIICEDGIVIGSDSQTTDGTFKRTDINKINPVKFDGGQALVAESGSAALSGEVIRILQKTASQTKVLADDTIIETVKSIVRKVRTDHIELFPQGNTAEGWQRYFRDDSPCEVMVAYYFNKVPKLYTINFSECVPRRAQSNYAVSGCAANVAGYIVGWFDLSKLRIGSGVLVCAFVVEEAKRIDPFCSGPTRIGFLDMDSDLMAYNDRTTDKLLEDAARSGTLEFRNKLKEVTSGMVDHFLASHADDKTG